MSLTKQIWTQSSNILSFYDPQFDATEDSFEMSFVSRGKCKKTVIPVENVSFCSNFVSFSFSLNCELEAGTQDVEIRNTTEPSVYCSNVPVIVYDTPKKCLTK